MSTTTTIKLLKRKKVVGGWAVVKGLNSAVTARQEGRIESQIPMSCLRDGDVRRKNLFLVFFDEEENICIGGKIISVSPDKESIFGSTEHFILLGAEYCDETVFERT